MNEKYHTTNPLVNDEDIRNHYGIAAIFHRPREEIDTILIFFHAKYQFYTLPIGKVDLGKDVYEGMRHEMHEELGVTIIDAENIGEFTKTYHRGGNVYTKIRTHLFDVKDFVGEPFNIESNKHPAMVWMSINELKIFPDEQLSDVTRFYIAMNDILDIKSKKLME